MRSELAQRHGLDVRHEVGLHGNALEGQGGGFGFGVKFGEKKIADHDEGVLSFFLEINCASDLQLYSPFAGSRILSRHFGGGAV
jgi:hypothetical protein